MIHMSSRLVRRQIDDKLKHLQNYAQSGMPFQGWIRSIRSALGMTMFQLARRAALDESRISMIEKAELSGSIKISTMQKIGKAFGMRFVYGFVPDNSLEQMVRSEAEKVAAKRMIKLDKTMQLENQGLSDREKADAFEEMVNELLDHPQDIWDEDE